MCCCQADNEGKDQKNLHIPDNYKSIDSLPALENTINAEIATGINNNVIKDTNFVVESFQLKNAFMDTTKSSCEIMDKNQKLNGQNVRLLF